MARTQDEMEAIIEKALALKAKREEEKRELHVILDSSARAKTGRESMTNTTTGWPRSKQNPVTRRA